LLTKKGDDQGSVSELKGYVKFKISGRGAKCIIPFNPKNIKVGIV